MIKQVHFYIKDAVVGVGFRAWAKIQARQAGVCGWVKNTYHKPDIFGIGAPLSLVEDVELRWEEVEEVLNNFNIIK